MLRIPKGEPGAGRFTAKIPVPVKKEVPAYMLVKPGDPYSKNALAVLSALMKITDNGNNGGTCSYGMSNAEGKLWIQHRDVCHARLTPKASGIVAACEVVAPSVNHRAAHASFLTFMATVSPWAHCFLSKDGEEMLTRGVVYNVNVQISHMVSAAIAIRLVTEHSACLPCWPEIEKMDATPAFKYVCLFQSHPGGVSTGRGHTAFTDAFTPAAIAPFCLENKLRDMKEPLFSYKGERRYSIYETFARGGLDDYRNNLGTMVSTWYAKQFPPRKFGERVNRVFNRQDLMDKLKEIIK